MDSNETVIGSRIGAYTRACRTVARVLFVLAAVAKSIGLRALADRLACVALVVVIRGERARLGLPHAGGPVR